MRKSSPHTPATGSVNSICTSDQKFRFPDYHKTSRIMSCDTCKSYHFRWKTKDLDIMIINKYRAERRYTCNHIRVKSLQLSRRIGTPESGRVRFRSHGLHTFTSNVRPPRWMLTKQGFSKEDVSSWNSSLWFTLNKKV